MPSVQEAAELPPLKPICSKCELTCPLVPANLPNLFFIFMQIARLLGGGAFPNCMSSGDCPSVRYWNMDSDSLCVFTMNSTVNLCQQFLDVLI